MSVYERTDVDYKGAGQVADFGRGVGEALVHHETLQPAAVTVNTGAVA